MVKQPNLPQPKCAIVFGQFGPYHFARVAALQNLARINSLTVLPVQIGSTTLTYDWTNSPGNYFSAIPVLGSSFFKLGQLAYSKVTNLHTLCEGHEEAASPVQVFINARRFFRAEKVDIAFLPSYSPLRYFALFLAAKSLRIKSVMMNESHAVTAKAVGWKHWIKRQIVRRFDAALVGGAPHKRHFATLGLPVDKIFTGYDVVDNDFFVESSAIIRAVELKRQSQNVHSDTELTRLRDIYGLPKRYFLSLGRMVAKKNLQTLVAAYARLCRDLRHAGPDEFHPLSLPALVFVGSGELEVSLRDQASSLGLSIVDRRGAPSAEFTSDCPHDDQSLGSVFFYGFRQIDENPIFYSLADAFILPSYQEEWGLVVNEAMACSLPVIVSSSAGCVEDLLPSSQQVIRDDTFEPQYKRLTSTLTGSSTLEERPNGFVIPPMSVSALAAALLGIIKSDSRRLQMGKKSLEIVSRYSCDFFALQALRAAEAAMRSSNRPAHPTS